MLQDRLGKFNAATVFRPVTFYTLPCSWVIVRRGKITYGRWFDFRSDQKYVIINQPKPAFAEMSGLFSHYHNNCSIIHLLLRIHDCWMTLFFASGCCLFPDASERCDFTQRKKTPGIRFCPKMSVNSPTYAHLTALWFKHFETICLILVHIMIYPYTAPRGPWVPSASSLKALLKNI